jgi:hypothetical protein
MTVRKACSEYRRNARQAAQNEETQRAGHYDAEKEKFVREKTQTLQTRLLHLLLELDRRHVSLLDRMEALAWYNVCGDNVLHMCVATAYQHEQGSAERGELIRLAQDLINGYNAYEDTLKQGSR